MIRQLALVARIVSCKSSFFLRWRLNGVIEHQVGTCPAIARRGVLGRCVDRDALVPLHCFDFGAASRNNGAYRTTRVRRRVTRNTVLQAHLPDTSNGPSGSVPAIPKAVKLVDILFLVRACDGCRLIVRLIRGLVVVPPRGQRQRAPRG